MLPAEVEELLFSGRVIAERFRLERLLGRGGMGTVWQAHHLALDAKVAVKLLNAEFSHRGDIRARFAREAISAARIRSPHVVTVLDSGVSQDGLAYLAMELLQGEDLGRRLTRLGRCTVQETRTLVAQAARGLARAHAAGLVHRDLKPENLFVLAEGDELVLKILDFGIAKAVEPAASTHKTDTGQLLGTPTYMSPEQALGRPLDARSDLYSLAVVAYRCLAGQPPFGGVAPGELIVAVSTRPVPPPSHYNPELPPVLDAWFEAALAKDPDARPHATALQLADSFERACEEALRAPAPCRPSPPAAALVGATLVDSKDLPVASADEVATTVVAGPPASRRSLSRKPPRRGYGLVAGAAVAVVAFSAFAAWPLRERERVVVSAAHPALPGSAPPPVPERDPALKRARASAVAVEPAHLVPTRSPSERRIPPRPVPPRSIPSRSTPPRPTSSAGGGGTEKPATVVQAASDATARESPAVATQPWTERPRGPELDRGSPW